MKAMPLAACAGVIVALPAMGCKTNVTQGDAVRPVRAMKVGDKKRSQKVASFPASQSLA
jgi:hypothetical protein